MARHVATPARRTHEHPRASRTRVPPAGGWRKHTGGLFSLAIQSVTANLEGLHAPSTSTGLGDLTLGLRRSLWRGRNAAALQLTWTGPLGGSRNIFPGFGEGSRAVQYADLYRYRTGSDTLADFGGGRQALEAGVQLGWARGQKMFFQLGAGDRDHFLKIGAVQDSATRSVK